PAGRHLGDGRSADRRRDHVGAGLDRLCHRHLRLRPSLAHGAGSRLASGPPAGERALGGLMSTISIPIAAHFLTGSILSLVLPVGVFIVVAVWYVRIWLRGSRER